MNKHSLVLLLIVTSLMLSCKTKKINTKAEIPATDKKSGDDELDWLKKELPGDEVVRTENGIKFTFSSEVLFPTNSSYLSDAAKSKLTEVAKILKSKDHKRQIQIDGHTDATGSPEYNIWLSEKRAVSVKSFLVAEGIDESRIKTAGKGSNQPVDSNKTAEGRLKNRRVEVTLLK